MTDDGSATARLRRLVEAAALPGVEEGTSYGKPALKVAGKAFTGYLDETAVPLRLPMEQKAFLLEMAPELYFETDHYKGWPWLLVRLDAISDEELSQRLVDAWRFRAPRAMVKAFEGRAG